MLDQVFKEQDVEGRGMGMVEQKVRGKKEVTEKGRRDRRRLFYTKQGIMQSHLVQMALEG